MRRIVLNLGARLAAWTQLAILRLYGEMKTKQTERDDMGRYWHTCTYKAPFTPFYMAVVMWKEKGADLSRGYAFGHTPEQALAMATETATRGFLRPLRGGMGGPSTLEGYSGKGPIVGEA